VHVGAHMRALACALALVEVLASSRASAYTSTRLTPLTGKHDDHLRAVKLRELADVTEAGAFRTARLPLMRRWHSSFVPEALARLRFASNLLKAFFVQNTTPCALSGPHPSRLEHPGCGHDTSRARQRSAGTTRAGQHVAARVTAAPGPFHRRRAQAQVRALLPPDLAARRAVEYVAGLPRAAFLERYVPTMRGEDGERLRQCAQAND
jgi:hypothetical protein